MITEAYDLAHEFPEHRAAIHDLKIKDAHFAKLFEAYHTVAREIHRIEAGVENTSDEYAEELKKKRLKLKDEIFSILQKQGRAA